MALGESENYSADPGPSHHETGPEIYFLAEHKF